VGGHFWFYFHFSFFILMSLMVKGLKTDHDGAGLPLFWIRILHLLTVSDTAYQLDTRRQRREGIITTSGMSCNVSRLYDLNAGQDKGVGLETIGLRSDGRRARHVLLAELLAWLDFDFLSFWYHSLSWVEYRVTSYE
jgi:hypothetical protein